GAQNGLTRPCVARPGYPSPYSQPMCRKTGPPCRIPALSHAPDRQYPRQLQAIATRSQARIASGRANGRLPNGIPMIRVLILSDIRLYREGLVELLGRGEDIAVLGTATTWSEGEPLIGAL